MAAQPGAAELPAIPAGQVQGHARRGGERDGSILRAAGKETRHARAGRGRRRTLARNIRSNERRNAMHQHNNTGNNVEQPRVLAVLRSVLPSKRRLWFGEALRIAELQANKLLEQASITDGPVPSEIVTGLPRIAVEYDIDMPCSGASDWDSHRRTWVITLNALEPETRHRFSLLHEYHHIICHGSPGLVDLGSFRYFGRETVEYVAEYFAGCALMPKRLVKRAWGEGIQRLSEL